MQMAHVLLLFFITIVWIFIMGIYSISEGWIATSRLAILLKEKNLLNKFQKLQVKYWSFSILIFL